MLLRAAGRQGQIAGADPAPLQIGHGRAVGRIEGGGKPDPGLVKVTGPKPLRENKLILQPVLRVTKLAGLRLCIFLAAADRARPLRRMHRPDQIRVRQAKLPHAAGLELIFTKANVGQQKI